MRDVIKKSFLLGLGAVSLTKKKAEKLMEGLVKKGVISRKDGDGLIMKMLAEANREGKRVEKFVYGEIKRELKKVKPILKKAGAKAAKKGAAKAKWAVSRGAAKAKKIAKKAIRRVR